jgi:hypothetical protein
MDRHSVIHAQARLFFKPGGFTDVIGEYPRSWPTAIARRLDPVVIPKLLYRAWHASSLQICGRGT